MTRSSTIVLIGAVLIAAAGCASGATAPTRDRAVISRAELTLDAVASLSAFDAIQRLRPGWLDPRGAASLSGETRFPAVLMSNTVRDDIAVLHTLPVDDVESIRYLDARDATTRFGTGYVNGLIEILPRTGPR